MINQHLFIYLTHYLLLLLNVVSSAVACTAY